VNRAPDRAQGGLGIGLTLVKRLIELHGGSIAARSAGPAQGSEFVVRLPVLLEASQAPETPSECRRAMPSTCLRVLVVDDNRDAASAMGMLLRITGNEVRAAYDGMEAVRVAKQFCPDVVLLDIGLPRMNGYEAARAIRAQPWSRGMVLIATTGWGQDADRQRSREAGFDHHLVKPLDPATLVDLLASLHQAARA
jgi:CheY-like chemotaxis protein